MIAGASKIGINGWLIEKWKLKMIVRDKGQVLSNEWRVMSNEWRVMSWVKSNQ